MKRETIAFLLLTLFSAFILTACASQEGDKISDVTYEVTTSSGQDVSNDEVASDTVQQQSSENLSDQSTGVVIKSDSSGTEVICGFLDCSLFKKYLTDGTYKCGSDFQEGDYYIISIYGAEANYGVSDSPNDFEWNDYRVIRKVSPKKGQFVQLSSGAILVSCNEIDNNNLTKYGILVAGKDIPAGDYKVTPLEGEYHSDGYSISAGAGYQINNEGMDSEPEESSNIYEKQKYIQLQNNQYLIVNNARVVLDGTTESQKSTETSSKSQKEKEEVGDSEPSEKAESSESVSNTSNETVAVIPSKSQARSSTNSETQSSTHTCETSGCYKAGTHAITGLNGTPEYYCDEHYKEINDVIGMMEEDVGTGAYSEHICEVSGCNKEGTRSIIGFSGSTEYYCTQHYNEMIETMNDLMKGY